MVASQPCREARDGLQASLWHEVARDSIAYALDRPIQPRRCTSTQSPQAFEQVDAYAIVWHVLVDHHQQRECVFNRAKASVDNRRNELSERRRERYAILKIPANS